jgi:hypothetical protein
MLAFDERRLQDVQKLRQIESRPRSQLKIGRVAGSPPNEIELELRLKTAPSRHYPGATQEVTRLTISLPARYPLVEPIVSQSCIPTFTRRDAFASA